MEDIQILENIGWGSYGDVYKAFDAKKKWYRAVKIFKDEFENIKKWMEQPEVKLMSKLKHKNLVSLK